MSRDHSDGPYAYAITVLHPPESLAGMKAIRTSLSACLWAVQFLEPEHYRRGGKPRENPEADLAVFILRRFGHSYPQIQRATGLPLAGLPRRNARTEGRVFFLLRFWAEMEEERFALDPECFDMMKGWERARYDARAELIPQIWPTFTKEEAEKLVVACDRLIEGLVPNEEEAA